MEFDGVNMKWSQSPDLAETQRSEVSNSMPRDDHKSSKHTGNLPSNYYAIGSIYRRSRTKVYNKLIRTHSPVAIEPSRSDILNESPNSLLENSPGRRSPQFSPTPLELGPSSDSPSSFYYYKRRDMSQDKIRKAKSDESKFNQIKVIELLPVKTVRRIRNRSEHTDVKGPSGHTTLDIESIEASHGPISMKKLKDFNLRHSPETKSSRPLTLPPVRGKAKYNTKLQKIINCCEQMPPHQDMSHRVNLERHAVAEMNRQLEWTTNALSRIQDSDADMLEYLFGKLEEEELDFYNEIGEVKRYFKYFSNNPQKQLRMVSKMLKRRKNVVF